MNSNQKEKKQPRNYFKVTFFILLAWVCAAAFASSCIRPVHATTDLCKLTRNIFHLQKTSDWELDSAQASAILNSTALQPDDHVHALASSVNEYGAEK